MKTVFDVQDELAILRANGDSDSFGVFYQSASNPTNNHYVILKSEQEFDNLKLSFSDYDFKFNKLAV